MNIKHSRWTTWFLLNLFFNLTTFLHCKLTFSLRANTPKIDVLRYCANQATDVRNNLQIPDRNSFALLWDLLAILVRSNDNAEGHDFAELLLGSKLEAEDESDEIDVTSQGQCSNIAGGIFSYQIKNEILQNVYNL